MLSIGSAAALILGLMWSSLVFAQGNASAIKIYDKVIEPFISNYCSDCHGDGISKGGISLDMFASEAEILGRTDLWEKVLINVRSGLMPPREGVEADFLPTEEEIQVLADWIKFKAFDLDPQLVDPGHVVPRRLNRIEYQNTIRDLLGYKFKATEAFPPDDTGDGFDNNGEVLTLSTLLIEKYLTAAEAIVTGAVAKAADDEAPRFFSQRASLPGPVKRDTYTRHILAQFTTRAFRRPVEAQKLEQLVGIARSFYAQPGVTFEEGISRAMMAVLVSPRFLFRLETPKPRNQDGSYPEIDEFELASRLSYFLWSSMPDQELFDLAGRGELRHHLPAQIARMLQDDKIEQGLVENFTGQWLQTRDVITVEINGKAVLKKGPTFGNRKTKYDFNNEIRNDMQKETELYFEHVLREDRSVLEFLDSDYTFLNERLAKQYGIVGVEGEKFRHVQLPADSQRGGVLTQGTVLAVTSNPTRTSPVKRGVFILENILGTPPPPPPPDIPELEAAIEELGGDTPTLRETLALHREAAVCSSCHNRMDPLGLAFENFIPMGQWRDEDNGKQIDASGRLITGEAFTNARDLKKILANERRMDFYRCLTTKLMTYALGRSLNHRDTHVVDSISDSLEHDNGRISTLIISVIESPQFQKQGERPEDTTIPHLSTRSKP